MSTSVGIQVQLWGKGVPGFLAHTGPSPQAARSPGQGRPSPMLRAASTATAPSQQGAPRWLWGEHGGVRVTRPAPPLPPQRREPSPGGGSGPRGSRGRGIPSRRPGGGHQLAESA